MAHPARSVSLSPQLARAVMAGCWLAGITTIASFVIGYVKTLPLLAQVASKEAEIGIEQVPDAV